MRRTALKAGGGEVPLRIYHPLGAAQARPSWFCHGGSFCFNSLEVYDYVLRYWAAFHGLLCVSVGYRLAPEHPFPQGLEDCWAALEWAQKELSGPKGLPLCVAGDSSGGDLAAALCLMALQKAGPAIRAQALIYPVLDLADTSEGSFERYARGYFLESEALRRAYGLYLHGAPAEHPWASPLRAPSLRGCPRPSLRRRNATSWWTTGWSTPSGCRRPARRWNTICTRACRTAFWCTPTARPLRRWTPWGGFARGFDFWGNLS